MENEQHDAREHQQQRGEQAEEGTGDHVPVLGGRGLPGDGLDALGQHRPQRVDEFALAGAGVGPDLDGRCLTGFRREVLLGVGLCHGRVGDLPHAVLATEGGQTDDSDVYGVGGAQHGRVADPETAPFGGAAVDDDLAGGGRGTACGEPVRVEFRVADPVAGEGGRSLAADGSVVGADELAGALDVAGRRRDAGRPLDPLQECGADRLPGALGLTGDGDHVGAAYDGVGSGVGVGEQGVEARAQGVAHDERSGEERDAEQDGDERTGEAALVGAERGDAQAYGGAGAVHAVTARPRCAGRGT
ncbi:hypothetical protein GCM10015535_51300 [Streptomyces gelaticus]|uniref:Uncharacterized protein n=1 Tax=Streptomyces gelaticus TaxID=285446 RepID=A0ABQ2W4Y9_9ACTN|nr:hypothetical protein GCM10015535_51300 [Streptomyces gelaticus]